MGVKLNLESNNLLNLYQIIGRKDIVKMFISKPISLERHMDDKKRFEEYFTKQRLYLKNEFLILKDEINRIINKAINDGVNNSYMHIFFIEESRDLNLIFRFSDTKKFDTTGGTLELGNDNAYLLKSDGTVTQLDLATTNFTSIVENYRNGNLNNLIRAALPKNLSMITEYITYDMTQIRNFNDFEEDLNFELVCSLDDHDADLTTPNIFRLGLNVYIRDFDRLHHVEIDIESRKIELVYSGYYDLGNLKP